MLYWQVIADASVCYQILLDFESIDSMISVLKPLHELTDILAAEKRVSTSAVKPLVQHICNKILESNNEDTDLAADMKARIHCVLLLIHNLKRGYQKRIGLLQ